jgi:hypothetical protein
MACIDTATLTLVSLQTESFEGSPTSKHTHVNRVLLKTEDAHPFSDTPHVDYFWHPGQCITTGGFQP